MSSAVWPRVSFHKTREPQNWKPGNHANEENESRPKRLSALLWPKLPDQKLKNLDQYFLNLPDYNINYAKMFNIQIARPFPCQF